MSIDDCSIALKRSDRWNNAKIFSFENGPWIWKRQVPSFLKTRALSLHVKLALVPSYRDPPYIYDATHTRYFYALNHNLRICAYICIYIHIDKYVGFKYQYSSHTLYIYIYILTIYINCKTSKT